MGDQGLHSSSEVQFFTIPVFGRRKEKLASMTLSPHSVVVFRQCKQHYKFRYIDKLGDQYGKAKPYYTMANHVHATLRDFLSIVPVEQRTAENLEELLRRNWQRYRIGFRNRADEKRWGEKALAQLRGFLLKQDLSIQPFMLEAYAEAEITPGVILRGRLDRVDREPSGNLHIIDYKTGNPPEQIDWTQLELHALILSRKLPYRVDKVSFYYLSSGIIATSGLDARELERVTWDLLETAGRITREKHYAPTSGLHCTHCDFLAICPAKQKGHQEDIEGDFELWRDSVASLSA